MASQAARGDRAASSGRFVLATSLRRAPRMASRSDGESSDIGPILVSRAQVQAARLRLVTDRKQGKATPAWVRELAAVDQPWSGPVGVQL